MAGVNQSYYSRRQLLDADRIRQSRRIKRMMLLLLLTLDIGMLILAFRVGYEAALGLPFFSELELPPILRYGGLIFLHVTSIILMFYFEKLYHQRRTYSRIDQARTIIGIVTMGSLLAFATQELIFKGTYFEVPYPRSLFFYVWFFSAIFAVLAREAYRVLQVRLRMSGWTNDNLLIVGTGKIAREITHKIKTSPELGYNILGIVNAEDDSKERISGIPIIGTYSQLTRLIDKYNVEQVIIALPDAKRTELVDLISLCQRGEVDIKVYPDIFAYMAGDMNVDDLSGTPLLTVRDIAMRGWKLSLKRGLDVIGSFTGLVLLSPLMLLTAMLIHRESDGPIFYSQVRMGRDGRSFPMIKFRSMRQDAEVSGPGWTTENDPRVTKIGRFMRKTNWDEIPQLINVLLGQMSLVGPRPERPVYVEEFTTTIPRYMERHREKAGMTGWAQVNGLRGDTSITQRTDYDLWYVENWSLWLDIKIIIRTVIQTILGRSPNAY